jgi:prepilin-type processing-associated H-X9-DG protein
LSEKLAYDVGSEGSLSRWYDATPGNTSSSQPELDGTERTNAIVWFLAETPSMELARWSESGRISPDQDPSPEVERKKRMRPSSNHPGGFNMAFADGSVRFVDENISYWIYAQLMTPHGRKAKEPGTKENLSIGAAPWVGDILNEGDLQ